MYVNSGVWSRGIPLFLYSLCVREGRKFLLFHFVFFSSTNSSEAPPDSLLATGISAVHSANGGYKMLTFDFFGLYIYSEDLVIFSIFFERRFESNIFHKEKSQLQCDAQNV